MAIRIGPIGSTTSVDAPTWRDDELFAFEKSFLEGGVISGFAVSERGAGANMSVDVAAGNALIPITNTNLTPSKTYPVYFVNDATVNKTVTTADPTNPRKDRVCLRIDVSQNPDAASSVIGIIEVIAGTPAGSPSAPAQPSNAITLSIIDIPASDTTIANAQITDSRTYVTMDTTVLADLARESNVLRKDRTVFTDWSEKTIASGAITVTNPIHTVDTQADASTDDLDTINAQIGSGELIVLKAEHTDRTVVIKHNTGNIRTADGLDFSMDNTDKAISLIRKGSTWYELSRAIGTPTLTQYVKTVYSSGATSTNAASFNSSTAQINIDTHSFTIPANDLAAGISYEFKLTFDATWVAGNITITARLGSTDIAAAIFTPTDSNKGVIEGFIMGTDVAGASVAVRGSMGVNYSQPAANKTTSKYGSANVATNGTLLLQFSGQFSSSNASHALAITMASIKKSSTTAFT